MKPLSTLSEEKQIAFYDSLLSLLPLKTHAANTKAAKPHFIDTDQAIHDYKFVRFNTKRWVSILIFDIDDVSGDPQEWHNHITDETGIIPSYTLRTDNGIQFGIFLDKLAWIKYSDGNPTTDRERIKQLKKVIAAKLGEDVVDAAGSNRLLGIWRNPIVHDTVMTDSTYTLEFLTQHFETRIEVRTPPAVQTPLRMAATACKIKLSSNGSIQKRIDAGFYIGNRNEYLFGIGHKIVFEDRSIQDRLLSDMQQINNSFDVPGLTENEVIAIHSSIVSMIPTMYRPAVKKKHGKLFGEMQAKGIHGLYNRQRYAAFKTAQARTIDTAQKVTAALTALFEKGIAEPINALVSKESGISVRQYQRMKHSVTKAGLFLDFISNLKPPHIDLRAIVTPILERVYEGVKKRVERLKSGVIRTIELNRGELSQMKVQL